MPASLAPVANQLWQSTLCVLVAWLLTLALRKNRAAVRYRIWFAASVKFLIPFSLLVNAGGHLGPRSIFVSERPRFSFVVEQVSRPFAAPNQMAAPAVAHPAPDPISGVLFGVWLCGFTAIMVCWWRRFQRIRTARREGRPLQLRASVPVICTSARLEPGVFGIWKPVLLLPEGITERLSPDQLESIVQHELCHVRRRDNLTAAIHLVVESVFWFYPVVWWVRARLLEEREHACDQEVLRTTDPRTYAEGILSVCRFHLTAPVAGVSGVTGSNLRKRIEDIMANRAEARLNRGRKLMLAASAIAVVMAPVLVGIGNAPVVRAEPQAHDAAFAAVKIGPSAIRSGGEGSTRSSVEYSSNRLTLRNVDLSECIEWAYGVAYYQILPPGSRDAERFDVAADAGGAVAPSELRVMLRNLLATRFRLTLHAETRVLRVYEMVIAPGGARLPAPIADASALRVTESLPRVQGGSFFFDRTSMPEFAEKLSMLRGVDRPVVDRTGIQDRFDITLLSAASAILQPNGPSLFALVEEQLGLRMVPANDDVETLVVDHAEDPGGN